MKLLKITASSLIMMTAFSSQADVIESELPTGVKMHRTGELVDQNKSLVDITEGIGATSIRYVTYAASGMGNRNQADANYSGAGCMDFTTEGWLDAVVDLPNGSKLVSFTLKANDPTATGNAQMEVLALNGDGTYTTVVNTTTGNTPGTPGFFSETHFVDYDIPITQTINARMTSTAGSTAEVCAIVVGYVPPSVASDVIFVHNFMN